MYRLEGLVRGIRLEGLVRGIGLRVWHMVERRLCAVRQLAPLLVPL